VWCHVGHALDFAVALLSYVLLYSGGDGAAPSVAAVVAFDVAVPALLYATAHELAYVRPFLYDRRNAFVARKYNPVNQYTDVTGRVLRLRSPNGQLQREVRHTMQGLLVAAAFHVVLSRTVPLDHAAWRRRPLHFVATLAFTTYVREAHFYVVHRLMHPWFKTSSPYRRYDLGRWLYVHVHKLHHLSVNPGPWSGLSMHIGEHLLYYTCALWPLLVGGVYHPLAYLYTLYHATIAPIGGHDGRDFPHGASAFHYLHHAKYECNYGVPLVPFDRLFGTHRDFEPADKHRPQPPREQPQQQQ